MLNTLEINEHKAKSQLCLLCEAAPGLPLGEVDNKTIDQLYASGPTETVCKDCLQSAYEVHCYDKHYCGNEASCTKRRELKLENG